MKKQIAGHLLVECLVEQGVTHAFGVPGESYLAVLDGLSYAALLFLVALGMTLVFGVMNIVNMAHGSFYALGG
jgi:ABC-type branched-subunit amino acid transport system permease subunit